MTKSELVELIASKQTQLSVKDVELAVKSIIEHMSQSLADGQRIEIRGFGSFSLHRVTKNTGPSDRLLLIMSFTEKPGMIGSVERIRELYGKVTDAHLEAQAQRVRADNLMD